MQEGEESRRRNGGWASPSLTSQLLSPSTATGWAALSLPSLSSTALRTHLLKIFKSKNSALFQDVHEIMTLMIWVACSNWSANGFVAELNGTNIFCVKNGMLFTPFADACLHGITRGLVLELAKREGLPFSEKNLSLTEIYTADEVFATGTMGELTPVYEIDGRSIRGSERPIMDSINAHFLGLRKSHCTPIS